MRRVSLEQIENSVLDLGDQGAHDMYVDDVRWLVLMWQVGLRRS